MNTRARFAAALLAASAVAMAVIAACAGATGTSHVVPPPPAATPSLRPIAAIPAGPLLGVVVHPGSVRQWNADTGTHADLATWYLSLAHIPSSFVQYVVRQSDGAVPVIEIEPRGTSLAQVAAGAADARLTALRAQLLAARSPMVLSFAPEANGHWYAWCRHPRAFRRAWRHVHDVLSVPGVRWMWQMSAMSKTVRSPVTYWPGSRYVTWAGIDGYIYNPGSTYAGRFGRTLTAVRGLKPHIPVLIAETAVSPNTHAMRAGIRGLFAEVTDQRLLGFIYFDNRQHRGFFHPDWRLEDYPAALAAFRRSARQLVH